MRRLMTMLILAAVVSVQVGAPLAHPGGTDDDGCHTCHTDCDKWEVQKGREHCHRDDDESTSEKQSADDEAKASKETGGLEEGERVYVDKVLDGDTLEVRRPKEGGAEVRVRILGIDCPESHKNPKCRRQGKNGGPDCSEQIPRGLEAARRAAELVKHETVRLESKKGDGDFGRGGYGRLLAYVRLEDGRDFGRVLVEEGHCRDYGHKYPHPRHDSYESVQPGGAGGGEASEPSEGSARRTPSDLLSGCFH